MWCHLQEYVVLHISLVYLLYACPLTLGGMIFCGWHLKNSIEAFSLRFIHSHNDNTGFFRNAFREIVALTTSGIRVRHIVSSQDDTVAGLLER